MNKLIATSPYKVRDRNKRHAVTGSEEEEDVGGTIFMPASLGTNSGVFR